LEDQKKSPLSFKQKLEISKTLKPQTSGSTQPASLEDGKDLPNSSDKPKLKLSANIQFQNTSNSSILLPLYFAFEDLPLLASEPNSTTQEHED